MKFIFSVILFFVVLVPPFCFAAETKGLSQSDIFIAGQDGYASYRIPSLIATKRGTLLAFCEGRRNSKSDTGDIDLLLKRSTDSGKTWSKQKVIWDDGTNTCGNPCAVVDQKTGVIWLLLTHNPRDVTEAQIKNKSYRAARTVWVSKSSDDGKTWSTPANITASTKDPSWTWYATGPGVGIQIQHGPHKGRLVIPCDHAYETSSGSDYGSHSIYSDDHGKNWKLGGVIRPKMNECQVVELADGAGTLLMNLRSYFGLSQRAHSTSHDGGLTWSAPEHEPELIEPVCQASILRLNWSEKKDKSRILFSNPADESRRKNMTVRLSYDEGKTWPIKRALHENFAAYSCLTALPDKSIACLYERGEKSATDKITFARFTLDWLTGGSEENVPQVPVLK